MSLQQEVFDKQYKVLDNREEGLPDVNIMFKSAGNPLYTYVRNLHHMVTCLQLYLSPMVIL